MNIKNASIAVLLILTLGFGIGFGYYYNQAAKYKDTDKNITSLKKEISQLKKDIKKQKARSDKEVAELKRNLAKPVKVNGQANGIPPTVNSATSPNMDVIAPASGATILNPVVVAGNAVAFENTFQVRIKDGNGAVIKEVTTMTNAPDMGQFGNFSVSISFPTPSTPTGTIEAFEYSAKDGTVTNLTVIPVKF
ncbi:MAG TPA: hypothetical protein ENH19_03895 [Actinobacteria bacterium]|nr:hypothetical protein [Actinomycetes bacterium]HEX21775.1 hypothetical protein [Actinomycetota bacterium]